MVDSAAGESVVGYLFQLRYALYLALSNNEPDTMVHIETLDDIVFESSTNPLELIQTKHHSTPGNLTDASVDLWKTLRIWISVFRTRPDGSEYLLVTTQKAAPESLASHLRLKNRDENRAIEILDRVASTSNNKKNAEPYEMWKSLKSTEKRKLINTVRVADSSPDIMETDRLLADRLRLLSSPDRLSDFLADVEGKWFRLCIQELQKKSPSPIISGEIQDYARERARWYRREILSLEYDQEVPESVEQEHDNRQFVRQMRWINMTRQIRREAIHDYYRAFHQRSLWQKKLDIFPDELTAYDNRLEDEWRRRFLTIIGDLQETASGAEKIEAGKKVFNWANLDAAIHLRPDCTAPWICRGSLQRLAEINPPTIGWHPDYEKKCGTDPE